MVLLDHLIVWRLDRWGRSTLDLAQSLEELQTLGMDFVSIAEALDFTTPAGKAMAGLLSMFAEYERNLLSERVKAGILSQEPKENVTADRRQLKQKRMK